MSAQTLSAQTVALPVPPSAPPSVSPLRTPRAGYALKFTVAEYFALERASEIRYEYVEGDLIPMPGVTLPHNRISLNFSIAFDRIFDTRAGEVFIEAVRVRVSPTQYRYPDVVAICGEPETDGEKPPALLNPSVIVEVLSASTEATDKREKFEQYRRMPSLTDYILAAQDRVAVTPLRPSRPEPMDADGLRRPDRYADVRRAGRHAFAGSHLPQGGNRRKSGDRRARQAHEDGQAQGQRQVACAFPSSGNIPLLLSFRSFF